jgi:hypothetical protein
MPYKNLYQNVKKRQLMDEFEELMTGDEWTTDQKEILLKQKEENK